MKSIPAYVMAALMVAVTSAAETEESASTFRGIMSKDAWMNNMSPNNNPWTDSSTAGAIVGFAVFALSYLYVVVYIFYDINKSKNAYMEMVDEDKNTIRQLNVPPNMLEEWERDLNLRLTGKTGEEKNDDQLFGTAATLSPSEFQKFM